MPPDPGPTSAPSDSDRPLQDISTRPQGRGDAAEPAVRITLDTHPQVLPDMQESAAELVASAVAAALAELEK